jgi:hypothetical protein
MSEALATLRCCLPFDFSLMKASGRRFKKVAPQKIRMPHAKLSQFWVVWRLPPPLRNAASIFVTRHICETRGPFLKACGKGPDRLNACPTTNCKRLNHCGGAGGLAC